MSSRAYLAWRMVMDAEQQDLREAHRKNEASLRSYINPVERLTESEFRRRYRFSKDAFLFLSEELWQHTNLRSSQRVSRDLKILTALSFYQSGSYQRLVGEGRHLSQGAVSNYVDEVTAALNHPVITRRMIQFPTTEVARNKIKQKFYERYGIPGVIGCIDASHIRIFTPGKEIEHMYYCRKNFYSLNVEMVCDSDCRILAVNAKYGGATHDAFIWENSAVNKYMQALHRTQSTSWLLGDSGYPLRPWLMTPCISPAAGSAEANYTSIHGTARVVIENTFSRLKNRWRCCIGNRALHYTPEKCSQIIAACCVLHNIALDFGVPEPEDEPSVVEIFQRHNPVEESTGPADLLRGRDVRNHLMQQLATR